MSKETVTFYGMVVIGYLAIGKLFADKYHFDIYDLLILGLYTLLVFLVQILSKYYRNSKSNINGTKYESPFIISFMLFGIFGSLLTAIMLKYYGFIPFVLLLFYLSYFTIKKVKPLYSGTPYAGTKQMINESEGIRRLSIFTGMAAVVAWFVFVFSVTDGLSGMEETMLFLVIIVYPTLIFISAWGLVKAIYWIYDGFKQNKRNNSKD